MNFSLVRLAVFNFGILLEFTWGEKGSPVVQKANTENSVLRIQAEKFGFLFVLYVFYEDTNMQHVSSMLQPLFSLEIHNTPSLNA